MHTSSASSSGKSYESATPLSVSSNTSTVSSANHRQDMTPIVSSDAIAIVGMSLKFPGDAIDEESFWKIMMEARSTASDFPKDRINHSAHYNSDTTAMGTIRPKKGHFLKENLASFDAGFFDFTAAEASAMDPQQRGLLETTYRALENGGIAMDKIYGTNTAVYTGCFTADYMMLMSKDPESMPKYTATGVAATMLSNRISAFYNLHGPSMTIDTACSSSLVALDQACQSLKLGQSSMGIVAGCNLIYSLDLTIGLSNMGFLSPDGVCHSFDHRANGYARGEGFGVVIIKRLDDAVRDGDTIRAIIRATGTNQDGNTPLAQPSKEAQAKLMVDTYRNAGLDPSKTKYVEAHGTGTPVGDPLEATAIGTFFSAYRPKTEAMYVSSLKANFGHLEGAAGLAGLIKTVLILERGIIPPLAGFDTVNPEIDIDFLNIQFPLEPTPWPGRGLRRASINSFGFGGTNSHVVVDDAYHYMQKYGISGKHYTRVLPPFSLKDEAHQETAPDSPMSSITEREEMPMILAWSANDESTLEALTSNFESWFSNAEYLCRRSNIWPSLAHTLLQRRSLLYWRSFTVANPLSISRKLNISRPIRSRSTSDLSLAFVFTGQGAQWIGMGKELFCYEVFRKSILDAVMYLMGLGCYWHFVGAFTGELEPANRIDEPGFAQPLCTILQIALVELLASINVHPALVIGHSSGEIAAAYACGAIDRQSAWKLAYLRGTCSTKLAAITSIHGAMVAVGLGEQKVQKYLDQVADHRGPGDLVIACVNSPTSVTVSGNKEHLEDLVVRLQNDSIFTRAIRVPVAYHSPHMEHVASEYLDAISDIKPGDTPFRKHVNMVSSVTGGPIDKECLLDPAYWVRNMVSQVKFMQALQVAIENPRRKIPNKLDLSHRNELWVTDIIEIGPHGALSGPIRDCLQPFLHGKDIVYQSALARKKDACTAFLASVGQLHCRGYPAQLSKLNSVAHRENTIALPNLPHYPFNHNKTFWYESRISKGIRFQQHARNSFLGTPVPDWNPLDARWRHFLVLNDSHWIVDHKIKGQAIFPAAGMINMAIEAASQLAGDTAISAFEITNATFNATLDLSASPEGLEVSLQMTARKDTAPGYGSVYDWRLRVYQSSVTEVCRGTIRSVPAMESANEVDHGNYERGLSARARSHFDRVSTNCRNGLDGNTLYQRLWNCGYHFGSSFKRIQSSKHSATGEATAEVTILDGQGAEMPAVVHPATLDGILQIMLPGITEGGQNSQFATSLPTRIERMWISRTGLLHDATKSVSVAVKIQKNGFRTTTSDIVAFAQEDSVKVYVEGIETTSITDGLEIPPQSQASESRLCHSLVYKPDIDRMDSEQMEIYLTQDAPRRTTSSEYKRGLDIVLYNFLSRANSKLETPPSQSHLQNYFCWMRQQLDNSELAGAVQVLEEQRYSRSLYHDIKSEQPKHSKIYYRTGEHLANLVSGTSDPLTLLFKGSAMSDFYECLLEQSDYMIPLARYLNILTHKNPAINVLEVGAGTGGATKHIMKVLTQKSSNGIIPVYSKYCFTDISPSFFAQAQDDLATYPNIEYKVFDLEHNPTVQDFEPESFDLIVASLVLHATTSLDKSLQHLKMLLKPGGRLIAIEVTSPDNIQAGFVFGLLPGWWLSADRYRQGRLSPCLTPEGWHHALTSNGFSGVDHVFWDTQDAEHRLNSVLISTKLETKMPSYHRAPARVAIVSAQGFDSAYMRLCEAQLQGLNVPVMHTDLQALSITASLVDTLIIITDSYSSPMIEILSEESFEAFKKTLGRASNVLWISPTDGSCTNPYAGAVSGLARTLRSENSTLRFTTFEADVSSCSVYQGDNIHAVLKQCLSPSSPSFEPEIVERRGMLQIPRAMEDVQRNTEMLEADLAKVKREVRFGEANLRLTVKTPGLLDSLHFEQVEDLPSELAPDEVEVRVRAVGVNFKDCLVALGRISDDTLGTECAGIVDKIGSSCTLRPGDHVVVLALDTYRSIVRCKQDLVVKIPRDIPFTQASKLPTNFVTAYHALVELGHVAAGETVLIHAGAGGTGQAAIQIALHYGAEVFVTVGSTQKKEIVMSTYGIAADHIFYSRDTSFAQGIKHLTNGRGVDLVLNSLAAEELRASWECIAPYGRFLEIGKKDIYSRAELPMYQFAQNVSFSAIDIAAMSRQRPQLVAKSLKAVVELMSQKKIHIASPLKIFSIHEIEEAFRWLQSGLNAGSVAVQMDDDAVVPALMCSRNEDLFSPDATYALAGGLGGQGKSIIRWMTLKGAKNILTLSRSGKHSEGTVRFINDMKKVGVHVEALTCDITDIAILRQTLKSVANRMPSIKGCIHAAMVIRDNLFSSMTYDDWKTSLGPKITGSWNLHECFPSDLDFFIMLASTSGIIGSGGQANYATGNTYQDALAAYRIARGQKAVSLDLSVMQEDGYFVNHKEALEQYLRIKKLVPMTQKNLFTVLNHYCDPSLSLENMTSQVIMGLTLPADVRKKGEDLASWMEQPLFSHLHQMDSANNLTRSEATASSLGEISLSHQLASVTSLATASALISSALQEKLGRILCRSAQEIDASKPMHTHGVDSLVAVELRNWLSHGLRVDVSVFEILGVSGILALGRSIATKLGFGGEKSDYGTEHV